MKAIEALRWVPVLEQWWIVQIYVLIIPRSSIFPIMYRIPIVQSFILICPKAHVRSICRRIGVVEILSVQEIEDDVYWL